MDDVGDEDSQQGYYIRVSAAHGTQSCLIQSGECLYPLCLTLSVTDNTISERVRGEREREHTELQ